MKDRSAVSEIIRNTGAHETDVQLHFPGLLKRLRDALWADWHLSGPVCDGRRLKIDVVLLTHEVNALEYIDTVFEFKTSIQSDVEQRDIVLQIFDRMGYIFEAQPQRTCCWGVGMDSRHVLFVRCDRKSFPKFSATAPMTLLGPGGKDSGNDVCGIDMLACFLNGSPETRGYASVVLPVLWGFVAESRIVLGKPVFALSDEVVAKVARDRRAIERELEVLRILQREAGVGLVCPALIEGNMETENNEWPYGFRMERHDAVEVETEEEVVRVLSGALWRLAVVHAIGVAHGDVKPSNLLQHGEDVLLCDFGHSVMGDAEGLDGGTEAFRIVPRLFKKCKYQCDLEGLYWTAVVLWRRARGHHGRALGDDKRREQFGVLHFPDANEHLCPENRVLREFLCGQAQARELIDPNAILASVDAESAEEWKSEVCRVIKEKKLPPCPEAILDWFAKRQK